jgi:hypothetical protein
MELTLLSDEIQKTCENLQIRVQERFPKASLNRTCKDLLSIAGEADKTSAWIKRPDFLIRISAWFCVALLICVLIPPYVKLQVTTLNVNIADFFQMIDSSFNIIVVLGGTWFYLITNEIRQKRKKVISAINKLKCLAHIIDAHQLTKDPTSSTFLKTDSSPVRKLSDYELGRYLDYCSEMLSLIGKIAFLYIQDFEDPIANDHVNDLENLTTGLCQKIGLKALMIDRIPITKIKNI